MWSFKLKRQCSIKKVELYSGKTVLDKKVEFYSKETVPETKVELYRKNTVLDTTL